ncbi:hypothetical protein MNBD_GAMMA05-687 [hydrothermal vent metagenome]|uniref:Flagellar hook-length control protein-like C-terminal domain-containing protein n=1 Tax=hydrothermal vent metagenome TaxID=652676 RepID=A0A3B0X8A1_9ZZZZ
MNQTINVTSTSSSTAVSGKSPNAANTAIGSSIQGDNSGDATESIDKEHSFSESLSRVGEHADTEKHDSNTDESGSPLPDSTEIDEYVANDDPLSLATIIETVLNRTEQSSDAINITDTKTAEKQLTSQAGTQLHSTSSLANSPDSIKPLPVDIIVKGEVSDSQLSSSIQSTSIMQNVTPEMTKSDTGKLSSKVSSSNNEKLELSQLNLDSQELSLDKKLFSGLSKHSTPTSLPIQQLNMLNEIQGSLSQRLEASSITSRIDTVSMPLTQAANSSPLNIQSAPLLSEISVPLNSPGWSKAMSQQIVWMANQSIKAAEIRLNPANLGPVEVRLEINDDQINVALSSRHAAVREAMEMTMPKLREMLENDGLNLSDSNISHQSFAEQREQQAENQGTEKLDRHLPHIEKESVTENKIMQKMTPTSMVDYFI